VARLAARRAARFPPAAAANRDPLVARVGNAVCVLAAAGAIAGPVPPIGPCRFAGWRFSSDQMARSVRWERAWSAAGRDGLAPAMNGGEERMKGSRTIGFLVAAGALLAAVGPAAAQTRPDVSFSESSRSSGPTCVVGGAASDCAGSAAPFPAAPFPAAPVVVAPFPVVVSAPLAGGILGSPVGDGVSTDVDVDRSNRSGLSAAR